MLLLNKLWPGHLTERGGQEHLVQCPFCGEDSGKCSVNVKKNVFQCWVCENSGGVRRFLWHLKTQKIIRRKDFDIVVAKLGYRGSMAFSSLATPVREEEEQKHLWTEKEPCVFPKGVRYIEHMGDTGIEGRMKKQVTRYLAKRGLSPEDISRFNLHACAVFGTRYYGHIFFPVMDVYGRQMVFWTTRTTFKVAKGPKSLHSHSYYTRYSAQDILFNQHLIQRGKPVAVCEGPFDALTVCKYVMPAVAVLGKKIHRVHQVILRKRSPKGVYLCFDPEARREMEYAAQTMLPSLRVRMVALQGGDPNEISVGALKRSFREAKKSCSLPTKDSDPFDPSLVTVAPGFEGVPQLW